MTRGPQTFLRHQKVSPWTGKELLYKVIFNCKQEIENICEQTYIPQLTYQVSCAYGKIIYQLGITALPWQWLSLHFVFWEHQFISAYYRYIKHGDGGNDVTGIRIADMSEVTLL